MRLTIQSGCYVFEAMYMQRNIPQQAGFTWNPRANRWQTYEPEKAWALRQFADQPTQDAIKHEILAGRIRLAESRAAGGDDKYDLQIKPGEKLLPFQRAGIIAMCKRLEIKMKEAQDEVQGG